MTTFPVFLVWSELALGRRAVAQWGLDPAGVLMKTRRKITILNLTVVVIYIGVPMIYGWWCVRSREPFDAPRLIAAMQAFHQEHPERNFVRIADLVQGRYLISGILPAPLEQGGVVSLRATGERAQEPLAWCSASDGTYLVVLADGSAHQVSKAQAESMPDLTRLLQ
jgi:hypothetical protein